MRNAVLVGGLYGLCLGLVLAVASASAADLYVSNQGSDSNPGTSAQPFQTITCAYSKAGAGTTIHVLSGVYTDYTSGWGIHLGKSGTASSPIVLQSFVRGGAIIDGQNTSNRNVGFYIDGSYNTVDGFEIRNCPNGGLTIWADSNRIINNEIHHNGNRADLSTNGRDGVYSNEGTSGNFYGANSIHDNGRSGSNLDHGLYLCGANETVINNLLFRNAASGLQVAGYTTVSNMKVYNNVMAWNGTSGIILWMALSGVDIKNNIIYQNGHAGVGCYTATGSGVMVDRNLCYGNGYGSYDWAGGGSTVSYSLGTTVSADPAFVNDSSSGFDAHLGNGSPARGAGLNLYSVLATDKNGWGRPVSGAWDLGPYIYGSANTLPPVASFDPTSGAISAPFFVTNGTICQPAYTGVTMGGRAAYTFTVPSTGDYQVSALVTAPSSDNNSVYVNIDAEPIDPLMIWDIPVTTELASRTVSWRGNGTVDANQFSPKVFTLSAGTHQLVVRGREGNCQLGEISIVPSATTALPVTLRITGQAGNIQVRWPTNAGSCILQSRPLTSAPNAWTDVTNSPATDQAEHLLSFPAVGSGALFRLRSG